MQGSLYAATSTFQFIPLSASSRRSASLHLITLNASLARTDGAGCITCNPSCRSYGLQLDYGVAFQGCKSLIQICVLATKGKGCVRVVVTHLEGDNMTDSTRFHKIENSLLVNGSIPDKVSFFPDNSFSNSRDQVFRSDGFHVMVSPGRHKLHRRPSRQHSIPARWN